MSNLDRELRWLRAYALLTYPFACVPFLYLFFRHSGLDLQGYGAVVTVYYVAMFVSDVPTSVLADRLGQRAMLLVGPLLLAAGFLCLFCWRTFTGFCVGEALMGIGHSALSGPPSSVLYELLSRHGVAHRYLHEEGRIHALRLYGTGGSFLLGGALASLHPTDGPEGPAATILPTAGLCLLAAVCAARLSPLPTPPRSHWRAFLRQAGSDLWLPAVRWLLLYWIVLFALLRYPFHNYQVYLDAQSASEPLFAAPMFVGFLYALLNLAAAPLSRMTPTLVERLGRRALFWAMPLMLVFSMGMMAASCAVAAQAPSWARPLAWVGVLMFFLQQIPFGMHWALIQEFVNTRIQPSARSTVWSALSLSGRLCYSPVNQGLFSLQQQSGMPAAMGLCAALGLVLQTLVMACRPRALLRGGPDARAPVSGPGR